MTEKIVVALNGAPVSARTVEWALERAIERRQRIELVGIVGGVVGSVGEVGILNDALESTQAMLDAHAERIRTRGGGVGAAELRQGRCSGCQLQITNADLMRFRAAPADEVLRCEECDRILVRTSQSGL